MWGEEGRGPIQWKNEQEEEKPVQEEMEEEPGEVKGKKENTTGRGSSAIVPALGYVAWTTLVGGLCYKMMQNSVN